MTASGTDRASAPPGRSPPGSMQVARPRKHLLHHDFESEVWLEQLSSTGPARDHAIARLHHLLLGAARFEVARRASMLPHLDRTELDHIALASADDAVVALLAKIDQFRGQSRFTTWAYKFALLEAAVKMRRRPWQGRELSLAPERWAQISDRGAAPEAGVQQKELLNAIGHAIDQELTPHQREVLVAVALNEVPIDVLAERLGTSRGALYKTIHDARRKLRKRLEVDGHELAHREGHR